MWLPRVILAVPVWLTLSLIPAACAEPPPKVDLFGDPLPSGAIARIGTIRMRHGSGSYNGVNILGVNVLAYSPDGKMLASGGMDGTISVWNTATGKELHRFLPEGEWSNALAWSADGKELISAGGESGQRWNVTTGKALTSFPCAPGRKVLTRDGSFVACIPSKKEPVRVIETITGKEIASFGGGLSDDLASFSPDGKLLAVQGAVGEPCRLWDVSTGKELRTIGHPRTKELFTEDILAFSPDGKTIVQVPGSCTFIQSSVDKQPVLKIWDAGTGKELREITARQGGISNLAFSADGKLLATGTRANFGSVFVWNLETGKVHGTFGKRDMVGDLDALTFSPDGKTLAMGSKGGAAIRLWDLATWKEITFEPEQLGQVRRLTFAHDDKALAIAPFKARIALGDPTSGKLLRRFESASDTVMDMAFTSDDRTLVSGEWDRAAGPQGFSYLIRSWDTETGKERRQFQVKGLSGSPGLALSPDATTAAFGHQDGSLQLWNVPEGKMVRLLRGTEKEHVQPVLLDDDKRLVTIVGSTSLGLWDLAAGKESALHKKVSEVFIRECASATNGELLAGAISDKPEVHVWDLTSGKETATVRGHKGGVTALCLAPDGKLLASAGADHKVRLWDVATGKEVGVFDGHRGAVYALAFSHDGKLLATGGDDTTTLVWDIAAVLPKK